MKYRLEINTQLCVKRFDPKYKEAQKFLDSEVLKDCAPRVPMRTGYLMGSGNTGTRIGSGKIVYNAPYAKPMYYGVGYHFSKAKHPQACAQWFEVTKPIKIDAWVSGVNRVIRGG